MTAYLTEFSHFDSRAEMDAAARKHISRHWNALNATDRAVLEMIRRYSVKYGAAHLKHDTMAEKLGVSNSTVRRSLRKLEKLAIIERVKFIRRVMSGMGANIYAILPAVDEQAEVNRRENSAKPTDSKDGKASAENESLFFKAKSNNTTKDTRSADIKRGLRDKMPAFIYDILAPYLNADDLYQAYGALLRGKAAADRSINFEDSPRLFSDAILSVIHAYKSGRVRSFFAVLYVAARDTAAQIYRQANYNLAKWGALFNA